MSFGILGKTKIWRKSKTMLHRYRQHYRLHKTEDIYSDIAKDFETRFDT